MAEHVDLVGHTLEVGDRVAYPTQRGSSAHMCVAEILEIIDYKKKSYARVYIDSDRVSRVEEKDAWKVRLQPLHYTDGRSGPMPKAVMVSRVENLVRVGPLKVDFIDLSVPRG